MGVVFETPVEEETSGGVPQVNATQEQAAETPIRDETVTAADATS